MIVLQQDMRKFVLLISLLFMATFFQVAHAFTGDGDSGLLASQALEGQKLIFERRYDEALAFFKGLQEKYPDSPLAYFGEMAAYEVQMLETEDFRLENEFLDATKRGNVAIGRVMQKYHPTNEELFYSGALIGLDGFFKARKSSWWAAYSRGSICRRIFNNILKKDPQFIDATFGLGMYIYWRSVFTKELSFLPFFPDRRAEGIEMVEKIAKEGHLAQEIAGINLGIMYFEEKRYEDALKVFGEYLTKYPQNIVIRMLFGKVLIADKKYDRAVLEFQKVLAAEPKLNKPHYFIGMAMAMDGDKNNFIEAETQLNKFLGATDQRLWKSYSLYWLGMIAEKKGDKERAKEYYTEAYKLNHGLKNASIRLRGLGGGI